MEENQQEHNHSQPEAKSDPYKNIVISIIVAALLICCAIFYNTNVLVKSLDAIQLAGVSQTAAPATAQTAPAAPTGPVTIADRSNEPVLGNQNAKVTMVEFGDFQCPFCKQYYDQSFQEIKTKYIDTGKVKLIFRHFPLTQIHVNAQISGVAAECANVQGKFWEYYNLLYTNGQGDGTNLDKASLEKYATSLGLNSGFLGIGKNKFNTCLESNATLSVVTADQAEGVKDGVTGTPTFYINGQQIVGAQPVATFESALDAALKN